MIPIATPGIAHDIKEMVRVTTVPLKFLLSPLLTPYAMAKPSANCSITLTPTKNNVIPNT